MTAPPPETAEAGIPSPFLLESLAALLHAARSGPVLDVACGRGRNALPLAARGAGVVGIDRNTGALRELSARARARRLTLQLVRAELERGGSLPLADASCAGLMVFRYLFRPLVPELLRVLRPGGLLLYETFMIHQRELANGPRNPAFLLQPGELRELFRGLHVLHYSEAIWPQPRPYAAARLLARRPA